MPKITVHGGPSNANDEPPATGEDQTPAPESKAPASEAETQREEAPDYEALKVAELRELASERGLDTSGTKAELVGRLITNDAEKRAG
jgi:SAP domain